MTPCAQRRTNRHRTERNPLMTAMLARARDTWVTPLILGLGAGAVLFLTTTPM